MVADGQVTWHDVDQSRPRKSSNRRGPQFKCSPEPTFAPLPAPGHNGEGMARHHRFRLYSYAKQQRVLAMHYEQHWTTLHAAVAAASLLPTQIRVSWNEFQRNGFQDK